MHKFLLSVTGLVCSVAALQAANQMPNGKTVDCSQLTVSEQNFTNDLTPVNKAMFCTKFTAEQRQQAMQMAGMMDSSGAMMTSDRSVEMVAAGKGPALQPPQPSQPPQQPRGCPVEKP